MRLFLLFTLFCVTLQNERIVLPEIAVPTKYDLLFDLNLENSTFKGEVKIDITILKASNSIVLNSENLQISSSHLLKNGYKLPSSQIKLDSDAQTVEVVFEKFIEEGEASLTLSFEGVLGDKMVGLYRSAYTSPTGEKRYMAVTQFERLWIFHSS